MSALRSVLYPLGLVVARLGRRSAPVVLVVLGIAAGAAVVLGGRVGTLVAQDRAVAQAIERIPEGSRSVRAVWFGVPAQSREPYHVLDRRARSALAGAGAGQATSLVLFRESTIAGAFAGLGAVESLARYVTLRSGRLPLPCQPPRCEVLRLRGEGRLPAPAGLGLRVVGEAVLNDRVLFGDFLAPTDNALADAEVSPAVARAAGYHRPPPAPLFLADGGMDVLAFLPALRTYYRSYAWVSPLRPGEPRLWEIDRLAAGVARARSELQAVTTSFDLVAPVEELRAAQASSGAAGRRLRIVGGEAAVLLFAFALLAAMTLRADLGAARRRLAWYGARGWQLALLTTAEAGALALAGSALGLAVGALGGALVAEQAGAPVGPILARSVLSAEGLGLALLVAASATAILLAAVAARSPRHGRARFALDAAALGAAAIVALELARGDGTGDLVLLLPALVTFAAAVAVSRVLLPSLRLVERGARGRSLGLRLASLSLVRNPGYAVTATAFLVVSFGLALFAESYRSTLARGERDQAAYRVPLDFAVRQDLRRLIPVQDAASLERFRALGRGVRVEPVLRLTGSIARLEGESGITLLGVTPRTFPVLARLRVGGAQVMRGAPLPAGVLRLPVAGPITATANVLSARGRFLTVRPGELVPPGSRLVALTLAPDTRIQERGADAARAFRGTALIGPAAVGGRQVDAFRGWVGVGGAAVTTLGGGRVQVEYTLTGEQVTRLRPPQPTDERPVPVLATPGLAAAAAADGSLPLQIGGERVSVRVVGTLERFPTAPGEAVVGDRDSLLTLLNTSRPGAARVDEVWLGASTDGARDELAAALSRPPFHVLAVESRRALEAEARRDPIAHGTLLALAVAAAVALGLALAGILLTVLGDLRDERGELFDLEAQGASPALLRRIVRLRALTVALAGVAGGGLAGLALVAAVTDLVGLTARATAPQPPLALDVDALVIAAAVALYVLAASALVLLATRRAFAGAHPARVETIE